jgi:hypothetical protein
MTGGELSRRVLLHGVAAAGASLASLASTAAQGFTKSPQTSASYQDHPNGSAHCGICQHFQPPASCKVVAGRISANGWCRIYAAKAG